MVADARLNLLLTPSPPRAGGGQPWQQTISRLLVLRIGFEEFFELRIDEGDFHGPTKNSQLLAADDALFCRKKQSWILGRNGGASEIGVSACMKQEKKSRLFFWTFASHRLHKGITISSKDRPHEKISHWHSRRLRTACVVS